MSPPSRQIDARRGDAQSRSLYGCTYFVVDVGDPEIARHFDGRDERVRHLFLQGAGIRPAVHLNLQSRVVHEVAGTFAFQYLVLHGAPLNGLPIRLSARNAQFRHGRRKPELSASPSAMPWIYRRKPCKADREPAMTSPAAQ